MLKKRDKSAKAVIKTEGFHLKRLFSEIMQRLLALFFRPTLSVRLKEEPHTIYPSMSRREIKSVSAAVCRSAIQNAAKRR